MHAFHCLFVTNAFQGRDISKSASCINADVFLTTSAVSEMDIAICTLLCAVC
jgi:hypothetical protein